MKKRYIILLLSMFIYGCIISQNTYYNAVKIMHHINIAGPMILYGDTLICLGNGVDHDGFDYLATYMAKFDLEGNLIKRHIDIEPKHLYYLGDVFGSRDVYILGDTLVIGTSLLNKEIAIGSEILLFDIPSGRIIKKIRHESSYNDKFLFYAGLAMINDSLFAMLAAVNEPSSTTLKDIQLCITNIRTEEKLCVIFGLQGFLDLPGIVFWSGEKILVSTYVELDEFDPFEPYKKRRELGMLYAIDLEGNVNRVFTAPLFYLGPTAMTMTEDGNYLCAGQKLTWIQDEEYPQEWSVFYNFIIFQLNGQTYNMDWYRQLAPSLGFDYIGVQRNILPAVDGGGYVVAGCVVNFPPPFSYHVIDSLGRTDNPPRLVGIMQKISPEGDSIWMRTYSYVFDDPCEPDWLVEEIITTVIHSPDNGYILYGDILYCPQEGDTIWQNPAVLIKTDRYGCVVPGCHIGSDTTGTIQLAHPESLMLYPNPVSDVLYIYDDIGGECSYTVSDMSGRILSTWTGYLKNHTYILDTGGFSPGIYVVVRKSASGRIASGKFVRG